MDGLQYHLSCVRAFWNGALRKTCFFLSLVLVISAVIGYFTCAANPEITNAIVEYFMGIMADSGLVDATGAISLFGLLLNNWVALLFCVLYGFLPFLFLPVLILFSNAYLIGAIGAFYHINGFSLSMFLAGILPHGVLELPALVIAAAMGFTICLTLVKKIIRAPGTPPMVDLISNVLRTMLLVIFPLLIASAGVEAYITPMVMSLFA